MKKKHTINKIEISLHAILCLCMLLTTGCSKQPVYSPPVVENDHVRVDVSSFEPDVPRFFTYNSNGKNISFFVMQLDTGIVSFLDACASCYNHKRGYHYSDQSVTCRYCNMQFSVYQLEKGLGGCYPIQIKGTVQGSIYSIPIKTLSDSAGKF